MACGFIKSVLTLAVKGCSHTIAYDRTDELRVNMSGKNYDTHIV